jgi:hypothetical protein
MKVFGNDRALDARIVGMGDSGSIKPFQTVEILSRYCVGIS